VFRSCSGRSEKPTKTTIDDHRPTGRWSQRSRIYALFANGYIQQHPDLRGHQPDPAHGDRPAASQGL